MTPPPNDPPSEAWIEKLVHFDEALRLGRDPGQTDAPDDQMRQAQAFLMRLQSAWQRRPKKIGPYTLVRSLGQGSIGPAYLVEEPKTRKVCVLKILWPDLGAADTVRQPFLEIAKIAQSLRHPGIAAVRDVRRTGNVCLVVLDYCPGISLAHWRLKNPPPVPWQTATTFIARLADILDVAHRRNISHGNLKPSNLFVSHAAEISTDNLHEEAICVSDFALAKPVQESRLSLKKGLPWPAPHYLAPEQLQRQVEPASAASDLYALGVIWYELMTNRCPIQGTTHAEIFAHLHATSIVPPRQHRPEIPEPVEALVMKALSLKPTDRPESAQRMAESCRALLPAAVKPGEPPAWWKQWLGWK